MAVKEDTRKYFDDLDDISTHETCAEKIARSCKDVILKSNRRPTLHKCSSFDASMIDKRECVDVSNSPDIRRSNSIKRTNR